MSRLVLSPLAQLRGAESVATGSPGWLGGRPMFLDERPIGQQERTAVPLVTLAYVLGRKRALHALLRPTGPVAIDLLGAIVVTTGVGLGRRRGDGRRNRSRQIVEGRLPGRAGVGHRYGVRRFAVAVRFLRGLDRTVGILRFA